MNELVTVPMTNAEVYRASTDAAGLCREIVLKTAVEIQGRKYVRVEGWQSIAIAHGCTAGSRDVERVEGGVRAIGEIRRMSDGVVIATAEGFVGEDETTWYGGETVSYGKTKTLPKRSDYAIRAMAQTRAISRACRSAFAHVVVMIDAKLSTTPAEEVPYGGFQNDQDVAPKDTGPGLPDQADFYGCANATGLSAYQAKKDGLADIHDKLRHEASELPTTEALREFCETNQSDIAKMPKAWRQELRAAVDARAEELGVAGKRVA